MNAFIIGNGFDLAHKMKTRYSDFRSYLVNRFPELDAAVMYVPTPVTLPDGDEAVDETDSASLLCYLIDAVAGDDWADFESALGEIDLLECFDDLDAVYDRDGERNLWHEAYNNEDRASDLCCSVPMIKTFFADWVNTIEISKHRKESLKKIIDPENDIFISFNYTHTLEELYGCKNVIHMHGQTGEEIIVGHAGTMDYSDNNPKVPIGCFSTLQNIYDGLRKDTDSVIKKHFYALSQIQKCDQIFSIGFSYSDVDLPYIKTICDMISDKTIVWNIANHAKKEDTEDKKKEIKQEIDDNERKIQLCGFKGKFSTFSI